MVDVVCKDFGKAFDKDHMKGSCDPSQVEKLDEKLAW